MPELRLADDVRAWQKPETARPVFADRRMLRGNRARSAVSARSNQPWRGESCEGAFLLGERRPHGRSETAHRRPDDSPTLTRHKRFLHQRGEVLGTIPRHQLAHSRKRPNEKGPGLKPGPNNPVSTTSRPGRAGTGAQQHQRHVAEVHELAAVQVGRAA